MAGVRRLVRAPARVAVTYGSPRRAVRTARREPIATALLLTGGAVAIVSIKRGALPQPSEMASLALGAGTVVLLASFAPDVVTMAAGAVFLLAVLNGSDVVTGLLDRAQILGGT